jgi:hypothetical protein
MGALLAGCGDEPSPSRATATTDEQLPRPISVGPDARFQPPPTGRAVAARRSVGPLRCTKQRLDRFGVHLEIFARQRVVVIPAGIGVAPPFVREGAYVRGGRCSYPVRTLEPTGLIEVANGERSSLGEFFRLWGQPLSSRRVAGFRSPRGERVLAFVDGRRWTGDPRAIPLDRHAVLVLEVGGYVPPHRTYEYPPGL